MGNISFTCDRCGSHNFGIASNDMHIRESVYNLCDDCEKHLEKIVSDWANNHPYCDCVGPGTVRA
jgi:hypothetical protein